MGGGDGNSRGGQNMILLEFIGRLFLILVGIVAVLFAICLIIGVLVRRFPDEIKKKERKE
jgi:hypothetical protein